MKTLLYPFFLLFMLLVLGCHSEEKNLTPSQSSRIASSQITGKWKLTKIVYTSMIAGQANTSEAPPYEEIFELKADSTFSRYRSNGYQATGTYSMRQYSADEYGLLATFDDKALTYHDLPGYRQYSHTEGQVYLQQVEPDVLIESYMAVDGPSFYYQKIEGDD